MVQRFPQLPVDVRKQALPLRVPNPPQVIGQVFQPLNIFGQIIMVGIFAFCSHYFKFSDEKVTFFEGAGIILCRF